MAHLFLEGMTVDTLSDIICETVRTEIGTQQPSPPPAADKYLTRKETATRLKVSLVTLTDWVPWERWNTAQKGGKDEDGGKITLDFDNLCCDKQDLEYIKSNTFEDYAGIRVKCRSCKKENSLAGLFGLKLRVMKGEEVFYKPVLRSSNSVYYPIIFNSIFIPIAKEEELTAEL